MWNAGRVEERTKSSHWDGEQSRHLNAGQQGGCETASVVAWDDVAAAAAATAAAASAAAAAAAASTAAPRLGRVRGGGRGGCGECEVMSGAMDVDASRKQMCGAGQ
jgi:hypothetical protein